MPRPHQERTPRPCRAADELHQRLGRSPATKELGEQLRAGEEAVLEALAAVTSRRELFAGPAGRGRRRRLPRGPGGGRLLQMHVSRLQRRALARMHAQLVEA